MRKERGVLSKRTAERDRCAGLKRANDLEDWLLRADWPAPKMHSRKLTSVAARVRTAVLKGASLESALREHQPKLTKQEINKVLLILGGVHD